MATIARTEPGQISIPPGLVAILAASCVVSALVLGYSTTATPVTLVLEGDVRQLWTHQDSVAAALLNAGVRIAESDVVTPSLESAVEPNMDICVDFSHPVLIEADGHEAILPTHSTTVEQVLKEARVSPGPHDVVEVRGDFPSPDDGVVDAPPVQVIVRRAVSVTLHEDGRQATLFTTADTVGEVLQEAGITLYLADGVAPGTETWVTEGLDVYIDRSVPVVVTGDGRTLRTRTHRERVDQVLADLKIVLTGHDYTSPTLDSPLGEDATIRVVRVQDRFLIEQEPIAFETAWEPDPDLEIDNQRVLQEGARGIYERRIRVRYEDGQEVDRTVQDEYVAVPPVTKLMGYGTKIVVRTVDTPSGPREYWRVIRMLATSYSAATSGTSRSSPWYGRTRIGEKMRHGLVAVDPRVVSLRTDVYVPEYGVGYAADTGGAIKGRRIDLGYDDDNLVLWYRWVDVYLLTPVPPLGEINYVLGP